MLPSAIIKCEGHKCLTIQFQQDSAQSRGVEFYEKNPPIKFKLEDISCIATDLRIFDKSQKEYTLRINGRFTHLPQILTETHNITSNELGLDIFRK